jgi:hypothetical protein
MLYSHFCAREGVRLGHYVASCVMFRELSIGGLLYPAKVFNQYPDYLAPVKCLSS